MHRIKWLLRKAEQILQADGSIPLVKRGFPFVVRHFFRYFKYNQYYIYDYAVDDILKLNAADFMPKIDSFTLKIVSTNEESDELEAEGLEFRSQVINSRERLDKGAVAFCIFVDNTLVHIGWVVMTQQAKDSLDEPPYRVDFSERKGCTAGIWTSAGFRRKGLSSYGYMKRLRFMLHNGILIDRTAVNKRNVVGHEYQTRLSCSVCGEGRYLRVLWWRSWKERPLAQ